MGMWCHTIVEACSGLLGQRSAIGDDHGKHGEVLQPLGGTVHRFAPGSCESALV